MGFFSKERKPYIYIFICIYKQGWTDISSIHHSHTFTPQIQVQMFIFFWSATNSKPIPVIPKVLPSSIPYLNPSPSFFPYFQFCIKCHAWRWDHSLGETTHDNRGEIRFENSFFGTFFFLLRAHLGDFFQTFFFGTFYFWGHT